MRAATLIFAGSGIRDAALEAALRRYVAAMERYGAAVVHLSPNFRGQPLVGFDNVGAMASLVGELIRLGHRRIGYLSGQDWLLLADQVDFITFFGNEAANIDPDPEENLNVIPFVDYGQDIYGLAIASHPDYLAENPDHARCFVDGVRRGFEAALDDPEAAINALEAANPETAERRDVHERLLEGAFEYAGDDLLAQTRDKWEETQRVLADAGIIESTLDPDEFFTDEYQ